MIRHLMWFRYRTKCRRPHLPPALSQVANVDERVSFAFVISCRLSPLLCGEGTAPDETGSNLQGSHIHFAKVMENDNSNTIRLGNKRRHEATFLLLSLWPSNGSFELGDANGRQICMRFDLYAFKILRHASIVVGTFVVKV